MLHVNRWCLLYLRVTTVSVNHILGDIGLVVNSLMEQRDRGGDNQGLITQKGDNTFQPIRTGYCRHVTKSNKMASCRRQVAQLWTGLFNP